MKLRWEHVTTGNVWLIDDDHHGKLGGIVAIVLRQPGDEPWSVYAYDDGRTIDPKTGRARPMSNQGFTSSDLEEAKAWCVALVTLNTKDGS